MTKEDTKNFAEARDTIKAALALIAESKLKPLTNPLSGEKNA